MLAGIVALTCNDRAESSVCETMPHDKTSLERLPSDPTPFDDVAGEMKRVFFRSLNPITWASGIITNSRAVEIAGSH